MISCSVGSTAVSASLLSKGADPNLSNETGQTPLFYAVSKGWVDM
jgi:ankyrin repeat protein